MLLYLRICLMIPAKTIFGGNLVLTRCVNLVCLKVWTLVLLTLW